MDWTALLGDCVVKYTQNFLRYDTSSFVSDNDTRILGLYMVPISAERYVNEDVTQKLIQLCGNVDETKMDIVQVCFPAHFVQNDQMKSVYEEILKTVPWFGIPYESMDKCIRIRHLYGVKEGEFAFVLLDGTGKLITKHGYDHLLEEDAELTFPWEQPHVVDVLEKVVGFASGSRSEYEYGDGAIVKLQKLHTFQEINKSSFLGLYFSGHWCPPCKAFTTRLIETYKKINEKEHQLEIIYVSSDRTSKSYTQYLSLMPWYALPLELEESKSLLTKMYGVKSIPTLIIMDRDGTVITEDGRGEVNEDPEGKNFPWYSKPVNILTSRFASKLHRNPAIVLFIDGEEDGEIELAEAVLTPVSECVQKKYLYPLLFVIATDSDTSENIREFIKLEDASPLLTLIDIPLNRFSVMDYGCEITEKSIMEFVKKFYDDDLKFESISA